MTRLALVLTVIIAAPQAAFADARAAAAAHVERAAELHEQGKFDDALGELTTAYTLDPRADLLYAIGQLLVKLDRCGEAVPYYRRFLAAKPPRASEAGARDAIAACKTPPPAPVDHVTRATLAHQDSRFRDALAELLTAYTLEPRSELLYAIGQVHVKLGSCAEAITYYERFVASRPGRDAEAAANEAMETCRTQPPGPAEAEPAPEPEPAPAAPVAAAAAPPAAAPAWYRDRLGGALAGGGLACAIAGLVVYQAARGDLDDATAATTYARHAELVDAAHGKRTIAALLGAAAVGLTGAGVARYVLVRRRSAEAPRLALVPAGAGAVVTLGGRF